MTSGVGGGPPFLVIVAIVAILAAIVVAAFVLLRRKPAIPAAAPIAPAAPAPVAVAPQQPRPELAVSPRADQPVGPARRGSHDVFISYSSKDKQTADAICAVLEQNGIRCWIAPRDVYPGEEWAGAIIRAIGGARLFVLVFSSFANESSQIKREVERAANHEVPILPFRIQDVPANESLEYFISNQHWLDAFTPPLQDHAERLVATIKRLLGEPARPS